MCGDDKSNLVYIVKAFINKILDNHASYFTNGSGMVFKRMVSLEINISGIKQKPSAISTKFKRHSYGHHDLIDIYELTEITTKLIVIDIQSFKDHWFLFSMAASLT